MRTDRISRAATSRLDNPLRDRTAQVEIVQRGVQFEAGRALVVSKLTCGGGDVGAASVGVGVGLGLGS